VYLVQFAPVCMELLRRGRDNYVIPAKLSATDCGYQSTVARKVLY